MQSQTPRQVAKSESFWWQGKTKTLHNENRKTGNEKLKKNRRKTGQ